MFAVSLLCTVVGFQCVNYSWEAVVVVVVVVVGLFTDVLFAVLCLHGKMSVYKVFSCVCHGVFCVCMCACLADSLHHTMPVCSYQLCRMHLVGVGEFLA